MSDLDGPACDRPAVATVAAAVAPVAAADDHSVCERRQSG